MSTNEARPDSERPEGAGPTDPLVDDTEGHSLPLILGADAMSRSAHEAHRRMTQEGERKPIVRTLPRVADRRGR